MAAVEPVAHADPAGHGEQSDASSRLGAFEYVPAKQFEHTTAPDVQDCCTETSAYKVLPLHVIPPTALDVEILTVICPPAIALPGTSTASRILDFMLQLRS